MLEAGATAFVTKSGPPDALLRAVRNGPLTRAPVLPHTPGMNETDLVSPASLDWTLDRLELRPATRRKLAAAGLGTLGEIIACNEAELRQRRINGAVLLEVKLLLANGFNLFPGIPADAAREVLAQPARQFWAVPGRGREGR